MEYPVFKDGMWSAQFYLNQTGYRWLLLGKSCMMRSVENRSKYVDEFCRSEKNSKLDDSTHDQPICTALQVALIDLLGDWNI